MLYSSHLKSVFVVFAAKVNFAIFTILVVIIIITHANQSRSIAFILVFLYFVDIICRKDKFKFTWNDKQTYLRLDN